MRFYGFGNYYLSSLQQGLQAAHTVAELFVEYRHEVFLNEWAEVHKTMVLLNGGNSKDLAELFDFLNTAENNFPFAKFNEDEPSLNGALTYVGVILPQRIYETAADLRAGSKIERCDAEFVRLISSVGDFTIVKLSKFEVELCKRLNQYGLAK